ncbi:MAG TPA: SDR family oxidoreductase [Frankiaceae bacterium]|nr:SDR family oxidoreductase [Frankiaceae bacterium]
MRGLSGKVVLVAGGAGGIGTATCKRLGAEGASVVVADLNDASAAEVAESIRSAGGAATATAIDLRSEESVSAAVALTLEQYGGLDVLHANAADLSPDTIGQDSDAEAIPLEVFDRTIAVNLRGHLLCARHAIPKLLERGGGALVFTSSAAAFAGEPERPAYAMAKSGLGGLIRHIASRWGKQGIRANGVAPGLVLTDTIRDSLDPKFRDMALGVTRSARLGTPDDIAAAVAFLASDDSSWITGQVISVDGGAMLR